MKGFPNSLIRLLDPPFSATLLKNRCYVCVIITLCPFITIKFVFINYIPPNLHVRTAYRCLFYASIALKFIFFITKKYKKSIELKCIRTISFHYYLAHNIEHYMCSFHCILLKRTECRIITYTNMIIGFRLII